MTESMATWPVVLIKFGGRCGLNLHCQRASLLLIHVGLFLLVTVSVCAQCAYNLEIKMDLGVVLFDFAKRFCSITKKRT